jgi:replicative DNA helicase
MTENYQYRAEDALVGALLHMPAAMADDALDLVHDDDIADPMNLTIVQVARLLVSENIAPDPAAISIRARGDGTMTGVEAIKALTMRLGDLYESVPTPANWQYYALGVIDDAVRRAFIAMGTRVLQAAEGSGLDVMVDLLDAECRTVRRLLNRRQVASGAAPALRSVVA